MMLRITCAVHGPVELECASCAVEDATGQSGSDVLSAARRDALEEAARIVMEHPSFSASEVAAMIRRAQGEVMDWPACATCGVASADVRHTCSSCVREVVLTARLDAARKVRGHLVVQARAWDSFDAVTVELLSGLTDEQLARIVAGEEA